MAQYDVYVERPTGVLLLDVQTDLIDGLTTAIVVPLLPHDAGPQKIRRLHPVFHIDGRDYMMATNLLSAIPRSQLGSPKMNLVSRHDDIMGAIYMLFQGF